MNCEFRLILLNGYLFNWIFSRTFFIVHDSCNMNDLLSYRSDTQWPMREAHWFDNRNWTNSNVSFGKIRFIARLLFAIFYYFCLWNEWIYDCYWKWTHWKRTMNGKGRYLHEFNFVFFSNHKMKYLIIIISFGFFFPLLQCCNVITYVRSTHRDKNWKKIDQLLPSSEKFGQFYKLSNFRISNDWNCCNEKGFVQNEKCLTV